MTVYWWVRICHVRAIALQLTVLYTEVVELWLSYAEVRLDEKVKISTVSTTRSNHEHIVAFVQSMLKICCVQRAKG